MNIHNVFHVDLLLPYKEMAAYSTPFTRPLPIIDSEEEYEIEAILDARCKGRGCQLQYLVHWKGYPHSNDSWIAHKDLHPLTSSPNSCIPTPLQLGDRKYKGRPSVSPKILILSSSPLL